MVPTTYYKRKEAGVCTKCGKRPPMEGKTVCRSCMGYIVRRKRTTKHEQKLELINALGGSCPCGYNKNMAALTFHHIDPTKKESKRFYTYWSRYLEVGADAFRKEVRLSCENCHRETHHPELNMKKLISINIIKDSSR